MAPAPVVPKGDGSPPPVLSPRKVATSSSSTCKPCPSKKIKKEEEESWYEQSTSFLEEVNDVETEVKAEPKPEDEDEDYLLLHDEEEYDTGRSSVDSSEDRVRQRKKPSIHDRVGDIFEMAVLDHNGPRKSDFKRSAPYVRETDPVVLSRRSKQIEYGKNTLDYSEYTTTIHKEDRLRHHPKTPDMNRKYSRRAWDGLVRQWRCKLHIWDKSPEELDAVKYSQQQESGDKDNEKGQ